ncbi:hypothetical protein ARMA_0631 [Ardenticatena maritima]|uniref:N-acetyltransferase domain-containing protein n=1 Tax=Ardenticatena maritima TaxID=872965 RepID=A0A0N0RFC0_9CHLR|nr:GNAT family N-acetyltransferase [Ardenticatena maritima]KPL89698.1 hypothetical protein SE16_04700 [Ardenticatena maritima]GAP62208.1 hypothetical protein ARMA_0631 [Ardenticatena maritima]
MHLETARLILRDFQPDDWELVLAYRRDARYQRFYPETEHTPTSAQEFVRRCMNAAAQHPRTTYQLAIETRHPQGLIGTIGLRIAPNAPWRAEVGCELNPLVWGKGYATEALRALCTFAFTRTTLERLEASTLAENQAAVHVLQQCGFLCEGRHRHTNFFRERFWDRLTFSRLRSDLAGE